MEKSDKAYFGKRVRFSLAVLVAQLLLVGTAVSWCVHMLLIKIHGEVYFTESSPWILNAEIMVTAVIVLYAVAVFVLQWKRLGERRRSDDFMPK
jgi:hypothetical protein